MKIPVPPQSQSQQGKSKPYKSRAKNKTQNALDLDLDDDADGEYDLNNFDLGLEGLSDVDPAELMALHGGLGMDDEMDDEVNDDNLEQMEGESAEDFVARFMAAGGTSE